MTRERAAPTFGAGTDPVSSMSRCHQFHWFHRVTSFMG
ncbi:MAG: hypothetical protein AVDCRST_MAG26-1354 [uncultured Chloroflexia bacterium]|uniref:Uncharacterized protein n=1 Tax=uncultured Chloroflexia bacterium TaxID=1672391 RepID=A0A6J4I182_9CHLR|nr:MAG: hypothetical protein AVDCRST_MAG26-1354 [uncultured Chloroflexia bacterium]